MCLLVLSNIKYERFIASNIVKLYGRDTCGYTVKMKKMIDESKHKNKFTYIDVTTSYGKAEYDKLGVNGVPAFKYNEQIIVGAMPVEEVLQKLNVQ